MARFPCRVPEPADVLHVVSSKCPIKTEFWPSDSPVMEKEHRGSLIYTETGQLATWWTLSPWSLEGLDAWPLTWHGTPWGVSPLNRNAASGRLHCYDHHESSLGSPKLTSYSQWYLGLKVYQFLRTLWHTLSRWFLLPRPVRRGEEECMYVVIRNLHRPGENFFLGKMAEMHQYIVNTAWFSVGVDTFSNSEVHVHQHGCWKRRKLCFSFPLFEYFGLVSGNLCGFWNVIGLEILLTLVNDFFLALWGNSSALSKTT